MVSSLEKIKDLFCESCQLGKHVRSSFRHVESRVDFPFSVIYSDIWGPSRVSSMGYRYFVYNTACFSLNSRLCTGIG